MLLRLQLQQLLVALLECCLQGGRSLQENTIT
jgi:hypothetical protein